mmetsp:Transcript_16801/g.38509  ORF Transcript_16801/g.38509 Transcript_16801/m.38509 type:complete len:452 (+) Transcript_16801:373-1728(+)
MSRSNNQSAQHVTMPPATGFQYTPPSYLLRASDTTNRPWSKSLPDAETHHDDSEDNGYELPQEHRPQTRRESHLDAHFQQQVRNKQSRYRDIIKGETDLDIDSSHSGPAGGSKDNSGNESEDDSVLLAAANADSYADVHSARVHAQSSKSNELARKNRKERITGFPGPQAPRLSASSAETARALRAQRLRSSLLKQTPDEFDVQTKLEMRRLARKEEEAAARRSDRENGFSEQLSPSMSKAQERKLIEEERRALQAERQALAIAKEEAAIALMRAAELNEERIRQRELDARLEAERQEEERLARRREKKNAGSRSKEENSYYSAGQKNNSRKMKTRNFVSCNASTNTDGDTFMTDFDAENDFAFLNDLTGLVRDTGLLKTCGACFGDADDVVVESDQKEAVRFRGTSSNISSVFVPELVPCSDNSASDADGDDDRTGDSIRRSRVYAKYRE